MPLPAVTFKTSKIKELATNIIKSKEAVENLRPFWEYLWENYIIGETKRIFATDGYGEWPQRKSGGDWPLLRRGTRDRGFPRGRLYRSFVNRYTRDSINRSSGDRFVFGSNVPYAPYHEIDTKYTDARPIIGLLYENLAPPVGANRIQALFSEYFIDGQVRLGAFSFRQQRQLERRGGGRGRRGSLRRSLVVGF